MECGLGRGATADHGGVERPSTVGAIDRVERKGECTELEGKR